MITEDYVSFETAKLLKEKGFDGECRDYYREEHFYSEDFKSNWNDSKHPLELFSAPTIQMAMKWLRETHHIHIVFSVSTEEKYEACCIRPNKPLKGTFQENTYEQACESAINYCLKNLI